MDFDGFDLVKKPSMRDKPGELLAFATHTPKCMAVNTNGWLKAGVAVRVDQRHEGRGHIPMVLTNDMRGGGIYPWC
eukprot:1195816-Prorocentrum_minimum.AAC.13